MARLALATGYFGLVLVALALTLLGADLVASLDVGGHIVTRSVADWWAMFDPAGPLDFAVRMGTFLPGADGIVAAGLGVFAWVYPGLVGVILVFFFGPRWE